MQPDKQRRKVLAIGVYMPTLHNNVIEIAEEMSQSERFDVTQLWVANGGPPAVGVAGVTCSSTEQVMPSFTLRNAVLRSVNLENYDYVVQLDDDIRLPAKFVDRFLEFQAQLDFAIAQPARSSNSSAGIPFVLEMAGVKARQTHFVEPGPVVAIDRRAYDMVLPFDERSPMGWGYGQVWAYRAKQRGLSIGIVDCLPIDHSMRPHGVAYNRVRARAEKAALLSSEAHLSLEEALIDVRVFPLDEAACCVS